ncbi:hypothetical protein RchiOBHm_Chr1g0314171 [Rosa chinensis]|uniref:Uncharacterized protein n=1 Tax=Rosa chinensis TaxID=74649 RepID=A0A2P6S748_ROSCH|nr:hypothetical protein RchiOBHm_Chr1g0314171 [Rosa chinensis]
MRSGVAGGRSRAAARQDGRSVGRSVVGGGRVEAGQDLACKFWVFPVQHYILNYQLIFTLMYWLGIYKQLTRNTQFIIFFFQYQFSSRFWIFFGLFDIFYFCRNTSYNLFIEIFCFELSVFRSLCSSINLNGTKILFVTLERSHGVVTSVGAINSLKTFGHGFNPPAFSAVQSVAIPRDHHSFAIVNLALALFNLKTQRFQNF